MIMCQLYHSAPQRAESGKKFGTSEKATDFRLKLRTDLRREVLYSKSCYTISDPVSIRTTQMRSSLTY